VSQGTADRLREIYGYKADVVIPPGASQCFRPRAEAEVAACLARYKLSQPYLLSVASWEPRKNLELLVKVFLGMKMEGLLPNHSLVMAGGKGWGCERLAALVERDQRASISALGFVPEEDLPILYSGCDAFVFPSVYEGFGMPVLEARACGARVVTTDIPELREAGGGQAIYIKPDAPGLRSGILEALSFPSPDCSHSMVNKGWEHSAYLLAEALRSSRAVSG